MYYIAENIKYLREKLKMSFAEVSGATSIHKSTVASYEYGKAKPQGDNLQKLAYFFKVSPEDLMFKNIERISKINKQGESDNLNGKESYKKPGGKITMNNLINLSMIDLLALQKTDQDAETQKAIQAVITFKVRYESLENENKLLKEMIEILKSKK